MHTPVMLCSDLDRTILPNGAEPESPRARPLLHAVAARDELVLAYVSGRHEGLLREAIEQYQIPIPNFAIGDVGTTIYEVGPNQLWQAWSAWSRDIAPDWNGATRQDLAALLTGLPALRLQEDAKQNTFKLSYYTPVEFEREALLAEIDSRLHSQAVCASLIWSVDEAADVGLLDVLPARATKLHAVEFLAAELGIARERLVFAGDSGNDLPVLVSGLQAVLVRNAHAEVRAQATQEVAAKGLAGKLYLAQGDFMDMNGNYSAGVLEGLAHFVPETVRWLSEV